MNRKTLLTGCVMAGAITIVATAAAFAQGHVIQTRCDTLSTNPPRVRVTFAVLNLNNPPICSVHLVPIQSGFTPPDSCRVLDCTTPPGWTCNADASGAGNFVNLPGGPCIEFGQKFDGFSVVLDPLFCCYDVHYDDPNHNILSGIDTVCFECEKPTAARSGTWGQLKMRYR